MLEGAGLASHTLRLARLMTGSLASGPGIAPRRPVGGGPGSVLKSERDRRLPECGCLVVELCLRDVPFLVHLPGPLHPVSRPPVVRQQLRERGQFAIAARHPDALNDEC